MSGLPVIRRRYRPRTAHVSLFAAVYLVLPILLAFLLVAHIRSSVVGLEPCRRSVASPTAAFVRLTPEQSSAAMARVRTSWQLERGGPVSVEFDPADAAFECAVRPAAPVSMRRPRVSPTAYSTSLAESSAVHPLTPASLAAPPPEELAADYAPLSTEELFPRIELLRFDGLTPFKKGTRR